MSFRGRYPSKFRRTGSFHARDRPTFRERGRPFKRKYHESGDSQYSERIHERFPNRGQKRPVDEEKGHYSDYGRGRPFKKHISDRDFRPYRSRGRFLRGRQGHVRGGRGRRFESHEEFDRERSYERIGSPGDVHGEDDFVDDERSSHRRAHEPDEWFEGEAEEYYEENHTPFERGLRSPLTIHRRFDTEEFDRSPERSPERSRSLPRRTPSLERRHFSDDREPSFERLKSPLERLGSFDRRRNSSEFRRSLSIERRETFNEFRQSPERFVEEKRSISPEGRYRRRERRERPIDNDRRSFERSLSPPEYHRSRERVFRSSDRERPLSRSSRRSIERQIAYEKERLQQMLEHERKIHEKRSESSIERFLDDCKRSFENNPKSRSISRSSSFDRRDYPQRTNKGSYDRSLSSLDKSRSFKGLESITIERGRSMERSNSPPRQRSPFLREDFYEVLSDSGRKSRQSEYHNRRGPFSRNLSPEVIFDRKSAFSNISPSRALREERNYFLEQRERHFLEGQEEPFLEDRRRPFLGGKNRDYIGQREEHILHSPSPRRIRERSSEGRSLISAQPHRMNHFLGVGDGPFSENRSIGKNNKEVDVHSDKRHSMSPISQGGIFDVTERSMSRTEVSKGLYSGFDKESRKLKSMKASLELSPMSQSGSFNKREFPDYPEPRPNSRMALSPISQTGSFDKKEFSQGHKNDQELSPISQTDNFGKEYYDKNSNMNTCGTERPNSTDSMQKFLAELEDDERSISSREGHVEENIHVYKKGSESRFQDTNKFLNTSVSKKESEDIPRNSSHYDLKLNHDSTLKKNLENPVGQINQKEELFNAYEKSFLNQACDAYNENLFQGRYEQSSKGQNKGNMSKMDTQTPVTQTTPLPNFNTSSELNTPNVTQQISSRPPQYQNYDSSHKEMLPPVKPGNQYVPNQIPQNINPFLAGSNINSEVRPFFPNQAIGPMLPFQQMPGHFQNIPPMPFQQNALLLPNLNCNILQSSQPMQFQKNALLTPNLNCNILQPSPEFIGNPVGNPNFSWQTNPNQVSNEIPTQWKSQRAEFHNNPGNSGQTVYPSQIQQSNLQSSFPPQPFQNEPFPSNRTVSQTGNQPYNAALKQTFNFSNLQHSEKLNQNVNLPNKNADVGDGNKLKPWPSRNEPNKISSNITFDGNSKKNPSVKHNVKEVIVISDDEGQIKKYDVEIDKDLVFFSNGAITPKVETVEKYKNDPPTYDVLGKIFKGFVIYFGVKQNSELQKDPIEVLQESFSSAEGFERALDVEESSEYESSGEQICELRWQGLLLSHGVGESREEARQVAGIALINALAKTCYTIQTKYGYYNMGRYPRFLLKHPERPGYYKIIKRDEIIKSVSESVKKLRAQGLARGVDATHVNAVISFMDEFFKDPNTHCELMFGPSSGMEYTLGELQTLARHATSQGLQIRWFHGTKKVKVAGRFLGVSRKFSPQALKRYLLTEEGDTCRYRLFPPQGPRIDLLTTGNYYSPNMIKTIYNPNIVRSILPEPGSDGNLKSNSDFPEYDFPEDDYPKDDFTKDDFTGFSYDDTKPSEELNKSNQGMNQQSQPGWQSFGFDQRPSNTQSYQNTNPQFQGQGPGYQGQLRPFNQNPQNKGFNQSFQGSSSGTSNPYMQGGFKRNVPRGRGGKRGKWE